MGRYFQASNGQQRRKIVQVPASNPSIPVPWWAQGGKGIVRVTGCGGGASGEVNTAANSTEGGGAGAFAVDHPINIPAGVASLAAVIGAGGAAVVADVSTPGNGGGNTTLEVGPNTLRLQGGGNGGADQRIGGVPTFAALASILGDNQSLILGSTPAGGPSNGLSAGAATLGVGAAGGFGGSGSSAYGNGSFSLWGAPPMVRTGAVVANQSAAASIGHGAGGLGVYWTAGAAITSGAGAPGFLTLEFIEGF